MLATLILGLAPAGVRPGHAATPAATAAPPVIAYSPRPALLPGGEIFDQPTVLQFQLKLAPTNLTALREHPRDYTPATVIVNGQTFTNVGVKLKGSAGSFRNVDDHPAYTLHFSKWAPTRRLFGLRRLHLNNSVQDHSYLNEYIGGELHRSAGVPAARSAWATVEVNNRRFGLYVLKEAFEKEFLRCFFPRTDGNLYDGGFVSDINQNLNRELGTGRDDHADLKALYAVTQEKSRTRRWELFQEQLDVDRFVTYAALSVMLADWDGYLLNRNNYRVYFRPEDHRAVFMPHGMDQLFQRTSMEMDASWNGVLAWALFDIPQAQALYEERCRTIYTNIFRFERITNLMARACAAIKPYQPDIEQRAGDLEDRIRSRFRYLRRDDLLRAPPPPVTNLVTGPLVIPTNAPAWRPEEWWRQGDGPATLEGPVPRDGRKVLRIATPDSAAASWRGQVSLKGGSYRFEGRVRTTGVQGLKDGRGDGAGLRISGVGTTRTNGVSGDADWTLLSYDFEVPAPEGKVILVGELRASRGEAWFDAESLRVVRRGP